MRNVKIVVGVLIVIFVGLHLLIRNNPYIREFRHYVKSKNDYYTQEYKRRISPVYYIDTLHVPEPLILAIDSSYYILSNKYCLDTLDLYRGMSEHIAIKCSQTNLYRSFPVASPPYYNNKMLNYFNNSVSYIHIDQFFIDKYAKLQLTDTRYKLYTFKEGYIPQTFVLMCMASEIKPVYSLVSGTVDQYSDDDMINISFSKQYSLCLAPVYPKDSLRTMYYNINIMQ